MFLTQTRLGDDSAFWTETVIAEYSEGDDSAVQKILQCKINMTVHNSNTSLQNTWSVSSSQTTAQSEHRVSY